MTRRRHHAEPGKAAERPLTRPAAEDRSVEAQALVPQHASQKMYFSRPRVLADVRAQVAQALNMIKDQRRVGAVLVGRPVNHQHPCVAHHHRHRRLPARAWRPAGCAQPGNSSRLCRSGGWQAADRGWQSLALLLTCICHIDPPQRAPGGQPLRPGEHNAPRARKRQRHTYRSPHRPDRHIRQARRRSGSNNAFALSFSDALRAPVLRHPSPSMSPSLRCGRCGRCCGRRGSGAPHMGGKPHSSLPGFRGAGGVGGGFSNSLKMVDWPHRSTIPVGVPLCMKTRIVPVRRISSAPTFAAVAPFTFP